MLETRVSVNLASGDMILDSSSVVAKPGLFVKSSGMFGGGNQVRQVYLECLNYPLAHCGTYSSFEDIVSCQSTLPL